MTEWKNIYAWHFSRNDNQSIQYRPDKRNVRGNQMTTNYNNEINICADRFVFPMTYRMPLERDDAAVPLSWRCGALRRNARSMAASTRRSRSSWQSLSLSGGSLQLWAIALRHLFKAK